MSIYENYLIVLVVAYVAVLVKEHLLTPKPTKSDNEHGSSVFKRFQREFLAVYLTMMAADWMQGPYVYQLYSYYGFTRQENGILFIAGFGSSLIFGTWAGPIADLYGRKFTCMLYGVTYALSCMTKHINNFEVLMVGRLLGGFATSILWSAFESWMVSEHGTRDFPADGMSSTFSLMTAMNGFVAIASGFVAQWAVDIVGSPVAPFDVSALFLVGGTAFIYFSWVENYGSLTKSMMEQMKEALQEVKSDTRIALVGLQQSLFEGAMYTFVFMWTPSLARDKTTVIPHGLIFAAFMIACSLGGTLFGVVSAALPCHTLLLGVFVGSALCMAVPIFTEEPFYIFGAFVGFELLVGLFWPAIGTLRSRLVPEHCRATVMNLFRVPLNIIVCGVLYFQGSMDVSRVFIICSFFHFAAAAAALALASALNAPQTNGRRTLDMTGATTVLH